MSAQFPREKFSREVQSGGGTWRKDRGPVGGGKRSTNCEATTRNNEKRKTRELRKVRLGKTRGGARTRGKSTPMKAPEKLREKQAPAPRPRGGSLKCREEGVTIRVRSEMDALSFRHAVGKEADDAHKS